MKIKLSKSEHMDDWYTIVRAEHDGRSWLQPMGNNGFSFMCSERLTPDACIEGDAAEMLALANAIKARGSESFKRCAVSIKADGAHFHSPRNSTTDAVVSLADADAFADQVLLELATKDAQ